MADSEAEAEGYRKLEAGGKQVHHKRQGYIALFALTTVLIGLSASLGAYVAGHKHAGCESDYWKRKCRLQRGSKHHYRNFLARAGLLLPPVLHAEVSERQIGDGRLLVVGDVHGCRDELLALLEKANFTLGRDGLILAGDLVEKGPYSLEVIAEARRLGAMSVRGNHDDSGLGAYEALARGEKVRKKHRWASRLKPADAQWLAQLPWTISVPSHSLVVVHAGLVPEVPLHNQLLVDLYRMRELAPGDDTRWHGLEANPDRGRGVPWAQVWGGPQHVVFGHDHQRGLQDEKYATGIDTGVAYGDYLTGVLFPGLDELAELRRGWRNETAGVTLDMLGAEIIQVKAKRKYYGDAAADDEHSSLE